MRLYVQWALADPQDWTALDLSEDPEAFAKLPRKPEPQGGEKLDNQPGWLYDLNVQGVTFGYDHYHVEPFDHEDGVALRVTVWNDDSKDAPQSEFWADVWTFLPLAPDPRFGGKLNTRQSRVVYSAQDVRHFFENVENIELRKWSEFVPPENPIHGIWLPDELSLAHRSKQALHGWEEWK